MPLKIAAIFVGQFHIIHGPQILYLKCPDPELEDKVRANFKRWHDYYIPELPLCEQVIKIELDESLSVVSCAIQHRSDIYERKKIEFNVALIINTAQCQRYDQEISRNIKSIAFNFLAWEKSFQTVSKNDLGDVVDYLFSQFQEGASTFLLMKNKSIFVVNFETPESPLVDRLDDGVILITQTARDFLMVMPFEKDLYREVIDKCLANGVSVKDFIEAFWGALRRPGDVDESGWAPGGGINLEAEDEDRLKDLALQYLYSMQEQGKVILVKMIKPTAYFRLQIPPAACLETVVSECIGFLDGLEADQTYLPSIIREVLHRLPRCNTTYNEWLGSFLKQYPSRQGVYKDHIFKTMLFLRHRKLILDLEKHYYVRMGHLVSQELLSKVELPKAQEILAKLERKVTGLTELSAEYGIKKSELEEAFTVLGLPYALF